MSTLHTLDATETINRIISVFPPHQQKQVRLQLTAVLKAVVSQRLVPRADGKGRVAAVEILRVTGRVKELIEDKDRTKEIPDAISQGHVSYGMQTFDQSLMSLVKQGMVTYQEALRQATNPDDFALRFQGISSTSDSKWDDFEGHPPENRPIPGSQSFGQQNQAPPAGPPVPSPGRSGNTSSNPALKPVSGSGPRPAVTAAQPEKPAAPKGDDDFQIERF
jgi:twitching motility protein PilT